MKRECKCTGDFIINDFDILFDKRYEVSNYSRIKSLERRCGFHLRPPHIHKQKKSAVGYLVASLMVNGRSWYPGMHRVMCRQFFENPENKAEVNHKNYCRLDNRPENIEWATRLENEAHARKGLKKWIGEKHPMAKVSDAQVKEIQEYYRSGKYNQVELAKMYPVTQTTISWIILNKRKK